MSVISKTQIRPLTSVLGGIALCLSTASMATDISLALGHSGDSTITYRAGIQFPWQQSWFDTDAGRLSGYWTVGYTYWDSKDMVNTHSLSASPVLTWEFGARGADVQPFLEAGIGLAAFSRNKIEDRELGSSVNFEDRFGVGVRLYQRHTIGAQALHYSNAGFSSHNAGIESYNLYYRFNF
ncbi:MAG: acyloxyacyl hydrolase [Gammaproteobacteria bacterium]|uniref:Lipid A deacylase n=1 Tax=Tolumonas osonensis TaxID=675874 RepID=A0A841GJW2_9GAMM|nr:acyloxyacyl hydrolase [Tolumonas osonensis]MBB6056976.1 lipid A 3-O-deacylase [Tolumonas osonensis]NCB59068.1 acyloxyacyl hydrolase [Gammaproteobacteria bacterium]